MAIGHMDLKTLSTQSERQGGGNSEMDGSARSRSEDCGNNV